MFVDAVQDEVFYGGAAGQFFYRKGGDWGSMDIQVTEKQRLFMDAREDEVLYGGAAGWAGGKATFR